MTVTDVLPVTLAEALAVAEILMEAKVLTVAKVVTVAGVVGGTSLDPIGCGTTKNINEYIRSIEELKVMEKINNQK